MRAEAGKEPDTRGDTRTLVLCSTCCQAALHLAREPHSDLHTAAASAHHLNLWANTLHHDMVCVLLH